MKIRDIDTVLENESKYDVERILCYDSVIYKVLCKGNDEVLIKLLNKNCSYKNNVITFEKKYRNEEEKHYIVDKYTNKKKSEDVLSMQQGNKVKKITFKEIDELIELLLNGCEIYKVKRYYYESDGKYLICIFGEMAVIRLNQIIVTLKEYVQMNVASEKNYEISFRKEYINKEDKCYLMNKCLDDEVEMNEILI